MALFDRWFPDAKRGDDAPMQQTFCAIVGRTREPLKVTDGREDPRHPWMQGNPVQSYCGVPIRDAAGQVVGSLCHFDLKPCEVGGSELVFLDSVSALFSCHVGDSPVVS